MGTSKRFKTSGVWAYCFWKQSWVIQARPDSLWEPTGSNWIEMRRALQCSRSWLAEGCTVRKPGWLNRVYQEIWLTRHVLLKGFHLVNNIKIFYGLISDDKKRTRRNNSRCRVLFFFFRNWNSFFTILISETRHAAVTGVLCVVASFTGCQVCDEFLQKASGMFWQFCRKGKLLHNQWGLRHSAVLCNNTPWSKSFDWTMWGN